MIEPASRKAIFDKWNWIEVPGRIDGDLLRVSAMMDRKSESEYVRPAAPESPPTEPLHKYKPRMALRMPTKEEVNRAVARAIRRSAQQTKAPEKVGSR